MDIRKGLKNLAIGTSLAGLLALGVPAASASGGYDLTSEALPNGYASSSIDADGNCGAGSCGADKKKTGKKADKDSKKDGKKDGKKGDKKKGSKDGSCGAGSCGG